MKAVSPGLLTFDDRGVYITRWSFVSDGPLAGGGFVGREKEVLKACLLYIAEINGVELSASVTEVERAPSIEVERLTLDVIAQARWEPQ